MLFIHIDPTGMNVDGKVADLTLTYRVPGSGDIKSQTVTLAYPNDPEATPDVPYLSQPEMAPRYAMYNMFLGLRDAVQDSNYNCASVTLRTLNTAAAAWNTTHENADIAADLMLVAEYQTNLVAYGASSDTTLDASSCQSYGYDGDDGDGSNDNWGNGDVKQPVGCYSASRGGTQWSFALIGLVALWNRRRRR
jgi:MYXO-CTERM domain-containing protein